MAEIPDMLEIRRVSLSGLVPDPQNPRSHDERNRAAIRASLVAHGQVEPLVIQAGTGLIIAGNGRYQEMLGLGWTEADVVELDVDNAAARRLSVELNRTGELAGWDAEALQRLVAEQAGLLDGLFSAEETQRIFADLGQFPGAGPAEGVAGEPGALPALGATTNGFEYQEKWGVIVECSSEAHQQEVFEALQTQGMKARVVTV